MYDEVIANLQVAYDSNVKEREQNELPSWKIEERQHFLTLLQQEHKKSLLEIGAGTGKDSQFFQAAGLDVTATDLSPAMVRHCQQKGLTAHVMDFLHLDFPASSFDAIYALNCLLHVPTADLPKVLEAIQQLLKSGGLFFLGVYGGTDREGPADDDHLEPTRFFSWHSDEYMQQATTEFFELVSFKTLQVDGHAPWHFQSLILRRP